MGKSANVGTAALGGKEGAPTPPVPATPPYLVVMVKVLKEDAPVSGRARDGLEGWSLKGLSNGPADQTTSTEHIDEDNESISTTGLDGDIRQTHTTQEREDRWRKRSTTGDTASDSTDGYQQTTFPSPPTRPGLFSLGAPHSGCPLAVTPLIRKVTGPDSLHSTAQQSRATRHGRAALHIRATPSVGR
jgi:hypothetical protein